MKLDWSRIERDGTGEVKLTPEIAEDMWHLYNLISAKDIVKSSTLRKVQRISDTGSSVQNKVKLTIALEVETIDFDVQSSEIRLKGRNMEENEHIKMFQYHTIELNLNKSFVLTKARWDAIYLDRIKLACDPAQSADIAAVVMQQGLAHLCLLTSHMTVVRAKIEVPIPKKRIGSSHHDKAVGRFYENILDAIVNKIDFSIIKVVILASPAFLKDDLWAYVQAEAIRRDIRVLIDNKSKFLLCHSSSGHKHALKEVLADPSVASRITTTHFMDEVRELDRFLLMLDENPDRAFYGLKHVQLANANQAIEVLLITDELFRSADLETRKKYVALVESVKEHNGDVKIFSTLHVSGEQLAQFTGIAAILRFPMPDIEQVDQEDAEEEERRKLEELSLKSSSSSTSSSSFFAASAAAADDEKKA